MKTNRAAHERFFKHSLDLMVITDYSGKIKLVNPAWKSILGYTKIELEGKTQSEFLHPDDLELTQVFIQNKIEKGRARVDLKNRYRCQDCSYRWIGWNLVIFHEEGLIYGYGRDITESKQAEESSKKRERYLSTLVELQRQLIVCDDLNDYYPNFLQHLGETTNASRAYLFDCFLGQNGKVLASQRLEWCAEDIRSEIDNPLLQNFPMEEALPDLSKTLRQGNIFCKTLVECNESERELLEFQDILSILLLPLIVEGKLVGFFGFDICTEVRKWEELEITMLQVAATVVSLKLEHLKAETALRESEEKLRQLAENTHDIFWVYDLVQYKCLYVSPAYETVCGRSCESVYENIKNHLNSVYPEDKEKVITEWRLQRQGEFADNEYRILRPDGKIRWLQNRGFPIRNTSGEIYRCAGVAKDITERKQVEQQIKASLKEKEVLLKEIHHRVKNNLQVISSLLDLQACQSPDLVINRMFSESRNRVKAMALIHEKLYQSDDLSKVNIAEYIEALTVDLIYTYTTYQRHIDIQVQVDDIHLSIDTAIPVGLIVNELVSNALKHGFTQKKSGTIWIELTSEDSDFLLVVKNDGVKLLDNLNVQTPKSLGLQLVKALSNQLDGKMKMVAEPVTTFEVRFAQVNH
ncbi:MAG: PAS domain S-box protein [Symploca sp. SIO2B6]|nr:PAS domain S-box protein [Symploca sp. SIO2B6]